MFTNYSLVEVNQILEAKAAFPTVPIMVVANPDNGPGPAYISTYASGINKLEAAGITVLGYVPTDWGGASIAAVESQLLDFYQWYKVDGIYLDQMRNLEYSLSGTFLPTYYASLTSYVKSLGMKEVFGNSGADIPYYFVGTVSTIGYFENSHLPQLSVLGGWHTQYNKTNFAFFAYNITSISPYYIAVASDYVRYLYITNRENPSQYTALPSYFSQLMSDLSSLVPVMIETATPNGTLVTRGFNATVTQPDGTNNSGYTPATFDVLKGSTVTISIRNNNGYIFSHWANRTSNSTIVLSPTGPTTLIAYSSTALTNASLVTVHTTETNGIPVTGIWTTAVANGTVTASGYTPFTFVATKGANYSLTVANYSSYYFSSWANGTTNQNAPRLTITPNQDTLVNALIVNSTTSP
jgi:hypothetical protein